ncbi:MAG: hypothetical protein J6T26_01215 [Firmicutes bacterium]|nr:hypothetical protein [Bacillota bacterium]
MTKGITSSGFAYEYDEARLDDMRLVDVIAEIDSPDATTFQQAYAASRLITMLLGPEMKQALYEHIGKDNDGRVPEAELERAIAEIMQGAGKSAEKNS